MYQPTHFLQALFLQMNLIFLVKLLALGLLSISIFSYAFDPVEKHFVFPSDSDNRYIVLVLSRLGLANRFVKTV